MTTRTLRPRAALPPARNTEFCASACLFAGIRGQCAATCHASDMIAGPKNLQAPKPAAARTIDTRAIYAARNARPKPAETTR